GVEPRGRQGRDEGAGTGARIGGGREPDPVDRGDEARVAEEAEETSGEDHSHPLVPELAGQFVRRAHRRSRSLRNGTEIAGLRLLSPARRCRPSSMEESGGDQATLARQERARNLLDRGSGTRRKDVLGGCAQLPGAQLPP